MKYIKLFENFLLEAANTNLELKSIFKKLFYPFTWMSFWWTNFDINYSVFH